MMVSIKALAAIALTLIVTVPIGLGYLLAVDEETETGWETTSQASISDMLLNHETPYYMEYSGANNNSMILTLNLGTGEQFVAPNYVSVSSKVSALPAMTYPVKALSLSSTPAKISESTVYGFTLQAAEGQSIAVTAVFNDGHTETWTSDGPAVSWTMLYNSGVLFIGQTQYRGVSNMVASGSGILDVYEGQTVAGSYADPAKGWTVNNSNLLNGWTNGQLNESVTMMLHLENGGQSKLRIVDNYVTIARAGDNMTVNGTNLGKYSDAQVTIGPEGVTVAGVSGWPTMGVRPTTYNSITIAEDIQPFIRVIIATSIGATYRVDSAQIYAGTFPSTYNLTFDPGQLYPGVSSAIKLNSIGLYGDSISIAGTSYPVTDGRITIDGRDYVLKGALISSWITEGGQYSIRINNQEVAQAAQPGTLYFGGEWSVTATIYKLEETSRQVMAWHAGEFALDKTGLAAAGLIVCGITLIGLGMTGARSGAKIGLLLLVCGGAAMTYLLLI